MYWLIVDVRMVSIGHAGGDHQDLALDLDLSQTTQVNITIIINSATAT